MATLKLKHISLLLLILTALSSCRDDLFELDSEPGEGEAVLKAEVTFSPVLDALDLTRTDGGAIKHINSLCVLMYDAEGNLVRRVPKKELKGLTITNNEKTSPSDALPDGTHQAEGSTPTATFTISGVPFGKYQIYAVANMGDLDKEPYAYTDDQLATAEQLKAIGLPWDPINISKNDQMFGYFTLSSDMSSDGFGPKIITVNRPNISLHAWVKRAASKVTVAVDGSKLNEGVRVWIKSIQVKDIPEMCFLGQNNTAAAHLIENGEMIEVSTEEGAGSADAFNIVTKTHTYPEDIATAHTETAPAMFFYENMQGIGQNKAQAWSVGATTPEFPNGNNPNDKGYKDGKRNGTYVEVIGYYQNDHHVTGKAPEGYIIYRFMLGKNTYDNYDAQRNYHYKLTLMLKNNAWDTDWHIVYDPEPEILATEPYYISFLYNQTMTYPIKIVGGELIYLKAEIPVNEVTKNSWAPYWDGIASSNLTAEDKENVWEGEVKEPGPWNGFLSLRKTKVSQFGVWPATYPDGSKDERFGPNEELTYEYNKEYYYEHNRGEREYRVEIPSGSNQVTYSEEDGDYTIIRTAPGEYTAELPFYTRARVMVSQTGYTGNNPYAAYPRLSEFVITAKIKKSDGSIQTISKHLQIIQSRRILNPCAIWREANSTEKFHVELKILPSQSSPAFKNLSSDGPWKVVVDDNCKSWVEIIPTPGKSIMNPDGSISPDDNIDVYGEENYIDFSYKPRSSNAGNPPRGGIIRVYYNNFTCVHTIFVRQGYEPVSFYGSNVKWHTFNLRTGGYDDTTAEEAPAPEVEGSYFRKFNRQYPIDARSNTIDWFFLNGLTRYFDIALTNLQTIQRKWEEITTSAKDWGNFKVKINNTEINNCRLPSRSDWEHIAGNANDPRLTTVYGFGVLYSDGDTETANLVSQVYGATPDNHSGNFGMRGVIVCDQSTGTQIFLPIAASGYGRFKQLSSIERYNRLPAGWGGVLQYANRYTWYPSIKDTGGVKTYTVQYHPLFYDLWKAEGTYYWLQDNMALDINFNTMDIAVNVDNEDGAGLVWGPGTQSWAGGPDPSGSDAVHLRLVHE